MLDVLRGLLKRRREPARHRRSEEELESELFPEDETA